MRLYGRYMVRSILWSLRSAIEEERGRNLSTRVRPAIDEGTIDAITRKESKIDIEKFMVRRYLRDEIENGIDSTARKKL